MSKEPGVQKGILAYVTMDKERCLGGAPLSLLAKDKEELFEISEALAEAFLAYILQLKNGDCLIIKK